MVKSKKVFLKSMPLIGVLIFLIFMIKIDWHNMIHIIKNVNIFLLLIALLFSFIYIAGKSLRWIWILKKQEIMISFCEALGIYYATFYLSLFTPGKIGDASKYFYLKGRGVQGGKALVSIILDRVYDMVFLFCAGVITFIYLKRYFLSNIWIYLYSVCLIVIFMLMIYKYWNALKLPIMRFLPSKYRKVIEDEGSIFFQELKRIGIANMLMFLGITVVLWMIAYSQIWILTISLGLNINYSTVVFLSTIVSLSSILPISPSGTNIGTRDAALVAVFALFNLGTAEEALALSMLILSAIVFDAFCGYIAFVIIPINKAEKR